jgi:hypothetical protein
MRCVGMLSRRAAPRVTIDVLRIRDAARPVLHSRALRGNESNANLIALRTYQPLFLEAHQQHNCATSYHHEIQDNQYAIFRLLAQERATLGLGFNEKKQRYKIDQLLMQDNQPVSVTTRTLITTDMIQYFLHRLHRVLQI